MPGPPFRWGGNLETFELLEMFKACELGQPEALQTAILERCNVALDLESLQQAMQDAKVSA